MLAVIENLMSWRLKLFLLLLFFSVAPVALLATWTTRSMEESFRDANLKSLQALAGAKAAAIDQFTADRKAEVETMDDLIVSTLVDFLQAERDAREQEPPLAPEPAPDLPDLKEGEFITPPEPGTPEPEKDLPVEGTPTEPPPPPVAPEEEKQSPVGKARDELRRRLGLILWDQQRFEELMVVDVGGRVVASTFHGHEATTAAKIPYFQNGLKGTHVEPVFLSPITDRLTMVIATPIKNKNLEVIGVLAARLNLSRFFRIILDTTGLGETGETVVGKKVSDEIVFMAPTRHDADAALKRKVPLGSAFTRGLQEASRGQQGSGSQRDYLDVETLAAWHHVPSLDWGLLVKINLEEADGPMRAVSSTVWMVLVLLLVLGITASLLAARALVQPIRQLQEATEKISRGNFDVSIDIQSRDEIGELAESFERMVAAMRFFQARARGELEADEDGSGEPMPGSEGDES